MRCILILLVGVVAISGCTSYTPQPTALHTAPPEIERTPLPPGEPFRFTVVADNRPTGSKRQAFQWTLNEMNRLVGGEGAFLVMAGDFDPPAVTDQDFRAAFGPAMLWYPAVGNHEAETREDMEWVRQRYNHLPYIVRQGPAGSETTTYSFDYGSAHFVVLNQYFDGQTDHKGKGDVCDALYEWVKADLEATRQSVIFVVGHEPAFPQGRHTGTSLDQYRANRDRFWKLLNEHEVVAYFCGHTHSYGRLQKGGAEQRAVTWQVDAGNCGQGKPQTFIDVRVTDAAVNFNVYSGTRGREFTRTDSWTHVLDRKVNQATGDQQLDYQSVASY
ncbi:MAG: metallophosphoesterase [Phycisphaerae bacterium]|nr:metallophosphoesterase [Phycisphaerae bacterium]